MGREPATLRQFSGRSSILLGIKAIRASLSTGMVASDTSNTTLIQEEL
jgi:hypothetical protein